MLANEEIPKMNTYTKEQKLEHLRLFKASGKNCNEYCREKGIPRSTMHAWVHAFDEQGFENRPTMVKLPRRLPVPKARLNSFCIWGSIICYTPCSKHSRTPSIYEYSIDSYPPETANNRFLDLSGSLDS
jgi:hypothetical protein